MLIGKRWILTQVAAAWLTRQKKNVMEKFPFSLTNSTIVLLERSHGWCSGGCLDKSIEDVLGIRDLTHHQQIRKPACSTSEQHFLQHHQTVEPSSHTRIAHPPFFGRTRHFPPLLRARVRILQTPFLARSPLGILLLGARLRPQVLRLSDNRSRSLHISSENLGIEIHGSGWTASRDLRSVYHS
jgi:hypothetical protein